MSDALRGQPPAQSNDPAIPAAPAPPPSRKRFIRNEGFRLKLWPILFALFLGVFVPLCAAIALLIAQHFDMLQDRPMTPWVALYYHHAFQLLFALVAIALMKIILRADYGLHMPREKTYVLAAIGWGLFFGVLMTVVDYWPQLIAQKPPPGPYDLNAINVAGWLSFEGIFVGPSEEVLFRGLIVTFLIAAMPGKLGFWRFEISGAGVVVAFIFALAHFVSFFTHPWWMAGGQLIYAFLLGVLYAYWFEKSRSLLAPIIGHNVSDVTEFILIFAMMACWG